jgi:hypothetical protein
MQRIYVFLGTGLMICFPVYFCWRSSYDFQHRETWGEEWENDPRLYVPVLIGGLAIAALLWWRDQRGQKNRPKQKVSLRAASAQAAHLSSRLVG